MPFRSSAASKLSSEQALFAAALRALTRRDHSVHEMKEYLERRAEDKTNIPAVIARLREQSYLDDARFATNFARRRSQSRHQGRFRVARELRARGVPDVHIDAALDAVFQGENETVSVRAALKRKLASVRKPIDRRKLASLYSSLLRAGFSPDIVRNELRAIPRGDSPDLPDVPAEDL